MTIKNLYIIVFSIGLLTACDTKLQDKGSPEFIENLIDQMTVEEKAGQMAQLTLDVITQGKDIFSSDEPVRIHADSLKKALLDYHIGSVLNTANNRARSIGVWSSIVEEIQLMAREETRLKIPVLYGIDAIHGATYTAGATMFPQQIAQAATWNRSMVRSAAEITAYEVRASSIHWNFSPVLDLGLDPRWPRIWETFGEDPYLCSEMGIEVIKGYQGDENKLSGSTTVAACLKHFLGYSAAESGKDRTPADIPLGQLREYHLPAFKKAIETGAASIMINSGIINGIPVHANPDILTTLLKEELNFHGVVLTDWQDIENLHTRDKVASSHKEAIKIAINAGIDMSMVPYHYTRFCKLLVELINEGEIPMERIDDAVRRILMLKYKLGLFDAGKVDINNYPKFGSIDFARVAKETADEAITLLKNKNNILPLAKGTKILVTGPNADNMRSLNGGWTYSWQGEKVHEFAEEYNTFYEAIRNEFGDDNVNYVSGIEYNMDGNYWEEQNLNMEQALKAAGNVDVVVLCLGENTYTEKPGDLHDMNISKNQVKLAKELSKLGKPVILVLNEGRPRIISSFVGEMDAVLQTYLSGNYAGDALADVLSGDVNPSGKLPYTYPMYSNSLVPYFHKHSEENISPDGLYDYGGGFYPQWEFGFGLSYTSFEYSDLRVNNTSFSPKDEIILSVRVKNTGDRKGKEVVQLFSSDQYACITPDVKRLRRFKKVELETGEEKEIRFVLNARDLAFANADGVCMVEEGIFSLKIKDLNKDVQINKTVMY